MFIAEVLRLYFKFIYYRYTNRYQNLLAIVSDNGIDIICRGLNVMMPITTPSFSIEGSWNSIPSVVSIQDGTCQRSLKIHFSTNRMS